MSKGIHQIKNEVDSVTDPILKWWLRLSFALFIIFVISKVAGASEITFTEPKPNNFQPGVVEIGHDDEGHRIFCIKGMMFDNSGWFGAYQALNEECPLGVRFDHIRFRTSDPVKGVN